MSSTGQELLTFLENQLNVGTTSSSTNPTQTLLVNYLNRAQRFVAQIFRPSELKDVSGTSVSVTSGQTSVAKPSTVLIVENVFHRDSSSNYKELVRKKLPNVIDPNFYFGTNGQLPRFFEVRGGYISVDAPFPSTNADGLKIFGVSAPTDISIADLTPEIDLPQDYDMLIIYRASEYFYSRDDDAANANKSRELFNREVIDLKSVLTDNFPSSITLSNRFFNYGDK